MARKFKEGDIVRLISDPNGPIRLVNRYEENSMVTVLKALADDESESPESAYDVVCSWHENEVAKEGTFAEGELEFIPLKE